MGTGIRGEAVVLLSFLVFWALAGPLESAESDASVPVSLRGTELRSIESTLIDQEFKIHIYLPPSYHNSDRVFPAVYLTDSDAYFGFLRSMVANLHFGNLLPEVVVVGIAYEEDTQSYLRKRERDLLPAEVRGHEGSGNAEAFAGFIKEELLPFVESHYRVDPRDRALAGMSAGATFAAYVLCTTPELFHRYVMVSPYLIYGQEIVLDLEAAYAKNHDTLPARVYTAMGEMEPDYARGPWSALTENIRKRDYPDLRLEQELLDGLSHMDVVFTAYVNGMKEVFSEQSETLLAIPENYAACSGSYDLGINGMRFTVRVDNHRLLISRSGEYWDQLSPASDTRFAVRGNADTEFSFVTDETGEVASMIVHQIGLEIRAEKIE
jgi:predicted alpha/beta superfamily hydrolase